MFFKKRNGRRKWYVPYSPAVLALVTGLSVAMPAAPILAQETTTASRYEAAESLRRGDGQPADLQRALQMHEALAAEGYDRSLVRIASIHQELGDFASAIEYFQRARDSGSFFAAMQLANGHARGLFGPLSQPEQGFADLVSLAGQSDNQLLHFYLARAYEDGYGTTADTSRAIEMYQALADAGHGQSMARLAAIYADDDSDPADLDAAIDSYRSAADSGYDYGLIGLSRSLIEAGRGEEALSAITRAVDQGVSDAEARRAIWHYQEAFGPASDKEWGKAELVRLSEQGDVFAARFALRLHERRSRRLNDLDLVQVLQQLQPHIESGDRLATESVARAYRELSWLIPNARQKHVDLIETYGHQLGVRLQVPEQLEALYDPQNHAASRIAAYDFLDTVSGEGFVYGLVRLRSIERMAFTYALQKELADLGYYSGPTHGRMSSNTLRAILRFCSEEGIYDTCKHGPLTYDASLAISKALYNHRAGTS